MAAGRKRDWPETRLLSLWITSDDVDELQLVAGGAPTGFAEADAAAIFAAPAFAVRLDLGLGVRISRSGQRT
ncbi:MAG: hypothetical protein R3C44_07240 [Chloroflexota bacterium]